MTVDLADYLRLGLEHASWLDVDLWIASVAIGGNLDIGEVASITSGARAPTRHEYDLLAAALNDHFVERGQDHPMRYWSEIADDGS
jgi:hypothetical protein